MQSIPAILRTVLAVALAFGFAMHFGTACAHKPDPSPKSPSEDKAAILAGEDWKRLELEFQQWLAVQVVLTPGQIDQLKAKLNAEVNSMSAAELQQFIEQWNAKLKVLLGQDAVEAREWLGQNLVLMADGYRSKFLAELGLTNVADLSAAEIEQKMLEIRAKRHTMREQREFFDQSREQSVKNAQKMHAEWKAESQQATKDDGAAPKFDSYQSHYSPQNRYNNGYYPGRYVPAYGGPFSGIGWGVFW